MLNEDERLVKVLWDLFLPEIASGEPVRFCFSHDSLRKHFASSMLSGRDPLSEVCAIARRCFRISGNRALLLPEALDATSVGFSKAIVLVCQQILAVEEMISEGTQYSENAYFPRLRRLMDSGLQALSANPYSFDEFEDVWKTFAREVWKVEGSSDETITFEFGAYEGAYKARQFPLSQALFSVGDLSGLAEHCRLKRLRSASADDVWGEIRRERYHLCRRAQRLINSGFLRERLIEQVRRFAERRSLHQEKTALVDVIPLGKLNLLIGLDVIDEVEEEYFAFLISDDTGSRLEDTVEITRRLESVLGRRGYAFCALNKLGDCWTYDDGEIEVVGGEPIVLLARQDAIERGRAQLIECCPRLVWDDSRTRPLRAGGNVHVSPVILAADSVIKIRGGVIVAGPSREWRGNPQFTWLGGTCVDARSRKYLFPYLPYGVRFGEQEFTAEEVQKVSGSRMEWGTFMSALSRIEADAQYELLFPSGLEARMAVAVQKTSTSERMGYLFDSEGRLSPTLERLGLTDPAIVGFSCPRQRIERPAVVRTVAKLLRDLKLRAGRPLTEKERQVAWNRVSGSVAPTPVKRVIETLLRQNPLVRDEVISELMVC